MKSGNGRKEVIIITLLGCIPVIWLALLVAPFAEDGLAEVLINSDKILKDPFDIRICEGSLKTAALFLAVYIMSICIYHTSRRNYRKGEEHGSARVGRSVRSRSEIPSETGHCEQAPDAARTDRDRWKEAQKKPQCACMWRLRCRKDKILLQT